MKGNVMKEVLGFLIFTLFVVAIRYGWLNWCLLKAKGEILDHQCRIQGLIAASELLLNSAPIRRGANRNALFDAFSEFQRAIESLARIENGRSSGNHQQALLDARQRVEDRRNELESTIRRLLN